ncbi:hypothetical protein RAS2_12050 [Phycisphaerae bacterium RAS2]|nr:hypothetical protein RAS2_12050 [Phycisphaerae bacterium RAS2]
MQSTKTWTWLCAALLGMAGISRSGAAQAGGTDVAQLLDQKVENLAMSGLELPAALADLGKQVGVSIVVDDESAEMLPWGKQTKLADVTITNASLREALPKILGALGMTYDVRDQSVVVIATDPLRRLARRATWEELKLLRRMSETAYSPAAFGEFKLQYRITSKVDAPKMLLDQMEKSGQGSVAQVLETATGALRWGWTPEDDHIVIRTGQAQIAGKLSRRVTARYTGQPLSQILIDLGDKADVMFKLEPGLLLKLPPSVSSYTLVLQSTSIRAALELMAAETGLKYEIHADAVSIGVGEAAAGSGPATGGATRSGSSPIAAKVSIPAKEGGVSYEIFLREDELPAEFLEHREQLKQQYIQKLMAELAPDPRIRTGEDQK